MSDNEANRSKTTPYSRTAKFVSWVWRSPVTDGPGIRLARYHSGEAIQQYDAAIVRIGSMMRKIAVKKPGRTRDILAMVGRDSAG